jgi:integrase
MSTLHRLCGRRIMATVLQRYDATPYYIRFLNEAGLPFIRQHDHRHTFGSTHLAEGTPVHEVQALMGHTSPATTLGFYAHVMPGARAQNRTTIERAFGTSAGK